jgi:hypothetical protein
MIGGDEYAVLAVEPIFKVLGKRITHIGPIGCGQVAKACNQIMVAAQMVALGELLIMAQKAGADPEKVVEAIKGGAAQCWTLDNKPQRLFAGNRTPGSKHRCSIKTSTSSWRWPALAQCSSAWHRCEHASVQRHARQWLWGSRQLRRDQRDRTTGRHGFEDSRVKYLITGGHMSFNGRVAIVTVVRAAWGAASRSS